MELIGLQTYKTALEKTDARETIADAEALKKALTKEIDLLKAMQESIETIQANLTENKGKEVTIDRATLKTSGTDLMAGSLPTISITIPISRDRERTFSNLPFNAKDPVPFFIDAAKNISAMD